MMHAACEWCTTLSLQLCNTDSRVCLLLFLEKQSFLMTDVHNLPSVQVPLAQAIAAAPDQLLNVLLQGWPVRISLLFAKAARHQDTGEAQDDACVMRTLLPGDLGVLCPVLAAWLVMVIKQRFSDYVPEGRADYLCTMVSRWVCGVCGRLGCHALASSGL